MRRVVDLLLLVALIYGSICLLLFLFQGKLVFFPDPVMHRTPSDAGLDFQEHQLRTSDGERIHAWWLPVDNNEAPTVLFFHGNAGNISQRIESLQIFHELGLNSLIIDYRGYGLSTGKPDEQGTYLDAQAAYDYLRRDLGIASQRLIVFGRSLGGAVASWVASHNDCAGVILESSFVSVPVLGQQVYPWLPVRWLSRIRYDNAARMAQLRCPVLIIHSRDDQLIPLWHGQRLHSLAGPPKFFLEILGSHNNGFLISGNRYREGLQAFIKTLDTPPVTHIPTTGAVTALGQAMALE